MNGIARTFFAAAASLLRLLAWPPLWTATGLNALANRCDQLAAAPPASSGEEP